GIRGVSDLSRAIPRYELGVENIFRLFPDRLGNIWISPNHRLENVLLRWNPRIRRFEEFPASAGGPSLVNDRVQAFADDRSGHVGMGVERGGLWRVCAREFRRYGSPKEAMGSINWLHADRAGRIWFGSSIAGAGRIDQPEFDDSRPVRYTTREGLSSNEVQ